MSNEAYSQICQAVGDGHIDELKLLMKNHPELLTKLPECARIINFAVQLRNAEILKELVALGIDINSRLAPGKTVLATTVTQDDPEMMRLVLSLGADPTQDSELAYLPVNAAVGSKRNSLEILKLLHEYGCDVCQTFPNANDTPPSNALKTAMMYGKDDVVAYLKSLGCTLPEGVKEPT